MSQSYEAKEFQFHLNFILTSNFEKCKNLTIDNYGFTLLLPPQWGYIYSTTYNKTLAENVSKGIWMSY